MTTVQEQVKDLAEKFAMAKIENMSFYIYKKATESTRITVDFLNKFMETRLKYQEYPAVDIALQMLVDFPETANVIFSTVNPSGHALPIDERENVQANPGLLPSKLVDITNQSQFNKEVMYRSRWLILNGQIGKRVNASLKSKFVAYVKKKS